MKLPVAPLSLGFISLGSPLKVREWWSPAPSELATVNPLKTPAKLLLISNRLSSELGNPSV